MGCVWLVVDKIKKSTVGSLQFARGEKREARIKKLKRIKNGYKNS